MTTSLDPFVGLATTLQRFYPHSHPDLPTQLRLDAARNELVSFQVVVRTQDSARELEVKVGVPAGIEARVRRVGYVPMKHLNTGNRASEVEGAEFTPGLVPDPLFPESVCIAGPNETNAFWIDLKAPIGESPGEKVITIYVKTGDLTSARCSVNLVVHKAVLPARKDFPVTHWFYCDALSDFYHLKPFEEGFWPILEKYIRDLVDHGNDMLHTPIFTPSTDGVKKPTQLLRIAKDGDRYSFDWKLVRRYIELGKKCGIHRFEWAHFFTQWGCKNAIRIYSGDPSEEHLLWPPETLATSPLYRTFLEQFLPELKKFLDEEGILGVSYFHISDEPHGDEALANYRAARKMIRELAPWMKFMDALSQISFAKEGLVDTPIPILNEAPAFIKAGYPAWCYYCGGPRDEYLNRQLDTPLAKIRMSGWLFYRLRSQGFLHWGYNYWYRSQTRQAIDPFSEQAGDAWPGWAYGDTFVVYPGPDGPLDSIRWEVFAESLQDYALLQAAGISPDDGMLDEIKDYANFPKSADWILAHRRKLLDLLDAKTG